MPVHVEWDDSQQSILRMMCSSPWNWREVFDMFEQVIVLTEDAICRVDLILHGDGRLNTPTGNPWPIIRALSRRIPPNAGLQVVVKPDAFAQIIYSILHSALPSVSARIRLVNSMEEARSMIAQARASASAST
jgi:hypothetical protein